MQMAPWLWITGLVQALVPPPGAPCAERSGDLAQAGQRRNLVAKKLRQAEAGAALVVARKQNIQSAVGGLWMSGG